MLFSALLFALTINSVNPQVINSSDDTITISATASGLQNTQYLQAVFTKDGESSSNYFGFTKNLSDEWYKYKSSPSSDDLSSYFYNFTPISGTWSGQLVVKVDIDDDGYKGPGNYILKLFKPTSSSYAKFQSLITINIPLAASVSADTVTTTVVLSPNVEISLNSSGFLGESFKVSINLKNFDKETEYYLKLRGGVDESHLTKVQTKNGGSYFSDNENWGKFPVIKTDGNGNWTGEIYGLIGEDKDAGTYKIKLRIRKKETETFSESELKEIKFTAPILVINTPVATKSNVVIKEKPVVLGTKSAEVKPEIAPVVAPQQNKSFFPGVIVGVGMVFSALSILIWDIIRNKKDLWKKYLKIPGK